MTQKDAVVVEISRPSSAPRIPFCRKEEVDREIWGPGGRRGAADSAEENSTLLTLDHHIFLGIMGYVQWSKKAVFLIPRQYYGVVSAPQSLFFRIPNYCVVVKTFYSEGRGEPTDWTGSCEGAEPPPPTTQFDKTTCAMDERELRLKLHISKSCNKW
ncbi:hypothetical protein P154DRAFT_531465 [Amniculicola lignicola CBS 123094]|uniref:Uncharacterized protein n=1 Tax=Amniculicola lignicola CBS 123094 TaxID=1392246 RepID=A0A6A5WU77_9PLEO|nr:hypothetical protein P154DRAFT_531465 [Amniculicola lignicola CBS 123094]